MSIVGQKVEAAQSAQQIIENSKKLVKSLKVTLTQNDLQQHYQAILEKKSHKSKFFGFRQSRAPLKLIEGTHRTSILEEAWKVAVQEKLYLAIQSLGDLPFSDPEITSKIEKSPSGDSYQFEAELEVYPEIKIKPIRDRVIELPKLKMEEEEVDQALFRLRLQHATYKLRAKNEPSTLHDQVVFNRQWLDAKGKVTKEERDFIQIEEKDFWKKSSEIESNGSLDPSFRLQSKDFINRREGDLFTPTFENPNSKSTQKKQQIQILEILYPSLPEITRHWIKSLGIRPYTLSQLKKTLMHQLSTQVELFRQNKLKFTILQLLEESHPDLAIPRSLLRSTLGQQQKVDGLAELRDEDLLQKFAPEAILEAAKTSKARLFLNYLIQRYSVRVSADEVTQFVRNISHAGIENLPQDPKLLRNEVNQYILEQYVINIVKEGLILKEPLLSFPDFLDYTHQQNSPILEKEMDEDGRASSDLHVPLHIKQPEKTEQTETTGSVDLSMPQSSTEKKSASQAKKPKSKTADLSKKTKSSKPVATDEVKPLKKTRIPRKNPKSDEKVSH